MSLMARLRHKKTKPPRPKPAAKRKAAHVVHAAQEKEQPKKPGAIEFCDKCSSIMIPVKKGKSTYLKCRRCGIEKKRELKALKIVEATKKTAAVAVLEKDTVPLPMVEMKCENCNNSHAYFWLQQTRSADEPPTQFFRCTKCKYTWREYK